MLPHGTATSSPPRPSAPPGVADGGAAPAVIEVRALEKRFGATRAVDGLSFVVRRGETYGLLGPNGAGKTSTMRMLSGLSPPSGGTLSVAGLDAAREGRAVRQVLGVVTQHDGLDEELTVAQNLEVYGFLAGLGRRRARERAAEVLRFFGLAGRAGDEVGALSGGLRRRLAIARALLVAPEVVVLDEPTTGLDPQSRNRVWDELGVLKATGVTILMSTHYMEEAATLCDRVGILFAGRLLDEGTPPALVERHAGSAVAEVRPDGAPRERVRAALERTGYAFREVGALFRVTARGGEAPELAGLAGARVATRPATLEDVFLNLTGRELLEE